jgi:hypothetical protein
MYIESKSKWHRARSQNWNVHNFSRSTLLSLHIFVAHRTYVAVHIRGFKLLQYARFSVDMVRHGPSDFTYSTTVLWQVPVHYAGFMRTESGLLNVPLRENTPRLLKQACKPVHEAIRKLRLGVWA